MHIIIAVLALALLVWVEPASAQAKHTASVNRHHAVPPATHTVSVSVHKDLSESLSAQQVKAILADASQALKTNPGYACPVTFKLKGKVRKFGSASRPVEIQNDAQKNAVHRVDFHRPTDFHIKVVRTINSCIPNVSGGFAGCAWETKYRSIIVVHPSLLPHLPHHIVWAHEYGHLAGLSHLTTPAPNALMSGCTLTPANLQVTRKECRCLRLGPKGCGTPTPRPCPAA